ncbi:uncharacterized protein LOC143111991 isoform X2 [Alosa pseudoharengus]|uniref:uncharacterized protein LOC143111991 isoform X2 n=1 Tax=Alosa pseudoharengus TaxID=34774 RepID=UPI003F8CB3DF
MDMQSKCEASIWRSQVRGQRALTPVWPSQSAQLWARDSWSPKDYVQPSRSHYLGHWSRTQCLLLTATAAHREQLQPITELSDLNYIKSKASASEDPAMYPSEMAAAPQSMPKKTHKQLQHRRSDWSTGLSFTISSPKQPSVRPQTRPSSSGQYTARPASWQYPQASASEDPAMYPSEMAAAPQSMPKKTHKQLQHRRSDWSTGLSFTISSPKQPSVRPRTRPSSSGQYTARPASWQYPQERTETPSSLLSPSREASGVTQQPSVRPRTRPSSSGQYTARPASWQYPQEDVEEGAAGSSDTSVRDMSISFGEMDLDPKYTRFVPLSDTTSSSPSSGSVSSSGSTNGWAGRKWLDDEAKLMELFRTCTQCGAAIEEKRVATRASQIRIHWTCLKGHTGEWASCTDQRNMGRNNLLTCAATFFTRATYSDIKEWAELINLQLPGKTQFYAIQSKYLIPMINHAYKGQQLKILERISQLPASGQKLEMCGDAWCDSPGKHCYSSDFG